MSTGHRCSKYEEESTIILPSEISLAENQKMRSLSLSSLLSLDRDEEIFAAFRRASSTWEATAHMFYYYAFSQPPPLRTKVNLKYHE